MPVTARSSRSNGWRAAMNVAPGGDDTVTGQNDGHIRDDGAADDVDERRVGDDELPLRKLLRGGHREKRGAHNRPCSNRRHAVASYTRCRPAWRRDGSGNTNPSAMMLFR